MNLCDVNKQTNTFCHIAKKKKTICRYTQQQQKKQIQIFGMEFFRRAITAKFSMAHSMIKKNFDKKEAERCPSTDIGMERCDIMSV